MHFLVGEWFLSEETGFYFVSLLSEDYYYLKFLNEYFKSSEKPINNRYKKSYNNYKTDIIQIPVGSNLEKCSDKMNCINCSMTKSIYKVLNEEQYSTTLNNDQICMVQY